MNFLLKHPHFWNKTLCFVIYTRSEHVWILLCYDWHNGWYNFYVGMSLFVFKFLSPLNPYSRIPKRAIRIYVTFYLFYLHTFWYLKKVLWDIQEFLDFGHKCWMLGSGCWIQDAGMQDAGMWTLDETIWTLCSGHWTLLLNVSEQTQNPVSNSD